MALVLLNSPVGEGIFKYLLLEEYESGTGGFCITSTRGINQATSDSGRANGNLTWAGHTGELQTHLLVSGRQLFSVALGQE